MQSNRNSDGHWSHIGDCIVSDASASKYCCGALAIWIDESSSSNAERRGSSPATAEKVAERKKTLPRRIVSMYQVQP